MSFNKILITFIVLLLIIFAVLNVFLFTRKRSRQVATDNVPASTGTQAKQSGSAPPSNVIKDSTVTITIASRLISRDNLIINIGTTVSFENKDALNYTAIISGTNTPPTPLSLPQGKRVSYQFNQKGTFQVFMQQTPRISTSIIVN